MTRVPAPKTFTRRLVVIAVTEYDDDRLVDQQEFSAGISAQVATVEGWWASPVLEDSRRFTASRPKQLHRLRDLRDFLFDEELADVDDDEALVVYITGHGLAPDNSPQHFLRLPASDKKRPLSTAFPTADLITTVLDSRATHVLVIVDSCFSGRLEAEIKHKLKALRRERRALGSLVVLAAGDDESRPRLGQFTNLLRAAHEHCADEANGFAEPHLSWQDWQGIVGKVFDGDTMADLHDIWPTPSATVQQAQQQPSPCLPNPGYAGVEPVLDASVSQVGWTRTELDRYWVSRASGETGARTPGWYFTGRTTLVKRMLAFLGGDEGVLVVTGEAGSGKSALLARIVTLSDAGFRADETYGPLLAALPEELDVPEGSVDAAVLARNSDPDELAQALYEALGGVCGPAPAAGTAVDKDAGPLTRLRRLVRDTARHRGGALTLVVDGIDEARNPTRVITDLLRPLTDLRMEGAETEQPAVRLLLGIRSSGGDPSAGSTAAGAPAPSDLLSLLVRATHSGEPIRTDDAGATAPDIAAYVGALLQAPFEGQDDSTSVPDPARHHELAEAMAQEVSPSFLDARIAAERLRALCVLPDPEDPEWRRTLRQGTEALLREDLAEVARSDGAPAEHLMTALRASAFARGAGLPWSDIWPAAVEALSPSAVHDPDAVIRQVLDSRLSGYLTTAVEDGRTVYRPIHERIGETLRDSPHTLLGAPEQAAPEGLAADGNPTEHARLASAFGLLLPASPDQAPPPYLRRHLVAHAAAAGLLDDRYVPRRFLPWETSRTVQASLGLPADADAESVYVASWARLEPFLADAGVAARADSLRLCALASDLERDSVPAEAGTREGGYTSGITPRWNRLRVPGNILGRTRADLSSLVSFTLPDGSPLVAAGDQDGEVSVWDPLTGAEFGQPTRRGPYARALAVLSGPGGQPLLAVGCAGGVWTLDPQTGDVTHFPISEPVYALAEFTAPDGQARLAVGTTDGLIVCDPATGRVLSRLTLEGLGCGPVRALAVLPLGLGTTMLAAGGDDGTVAVMDADSFRVVTSVKGPGKGVAALALFKTSDGQPRLTVVFKSTQNVRSYDPFTGAENKAARIPQPAASIGLYPHPLLGTLLALGGVHGGPVRLRDPEDGVETYAATSDHTKRVKGIAVIDRGARTPLVASGSADRTVRIWNPESLMSRWESHLEESGDGSHLAVAAEAGDGAMLLGPAPSSGLEFRSASTGDVLHRVVWPADWNAGELTALATHTWSDGSASVIAGLRGGVIGRWDGRDGWTLLAREGGPSTRVRALATFFADDADRAVLVSATSLRVISYQYLATGERYCAPLSSNEAVRCLSVLPTASGPLVAYASGFAVRFCRVGEPSHRRLPPYIGSTTSLAVCPAEDGSALLATGGADGSVRLWSPDAPKQEAYPVLKGHRGPVSAMALLRPSPASQPLLVTAGGQDTTVRLWDPWTGEELARLVTGTGLTSICVLPADGPAGRKAPMIAFGGPAGTAMVAVRR
ncbi:AAA family ATPase [Streptomyces sp. NPDC090741]|uniref:AAA family ATPase n=1 Tax=Streptomyces sp. NPDC090741 TaxID=3365967 RepID=UPI003827E8A8